MGLVKQRFAESSHNLAFWHIKADGAGHSGLEGKGVVVWPAGHFASPYPFLILRKRSGLFRGCGDTHEPFPERDEMDDEVFVFFFSLIIPGDHEQASAVKFLTSPEQRTAFSFFNFGTFDVVTDLDERGDFSRFFDDKIDLCPSGILEIVKITP